MCTDLDCKLVHIRKSWSGYNEKINRGVFTIWDDRLDKKRLRYEFGEAVSTDTRFGAKELRKNIEAIISQGGEAFGIQSVARDVNASPRARKMFDKDRVLNLRLTQERGRYVALVIGEVTLTDIRAGFANRVDAYPDALNDLNFERTGQESPNKTFGTYSGFSRDCAFDVQCLHTTHERLLWCGLSWYCQPNAVFDSVNRVLHPSVRTTNSKLIEVDRWSDVKLFSDDQEADSHLDFMVGQLHLHDLAKPELPRDVLKDNLTLVKLMAAVLLRLA